MKASQLALLMAPLMAPLMRLGWGLAKVPYLEVEEAAAERMRFLLLYAVLPWETLSLSAPVFEPQATIVLSYQ